MTTPSKLRAVLYSAVSTEEQADPNMPSLDEQDAAGESFCKAQGWPIVARVRVEGHSRYYTRLDKLVTKCPEYGRFIDLLESQAGDIVVATDYDRFWRTDALRAQVAAISREHDVKLYAINQPVPLDNDVSSFWLELIFGGTAQQENWTRVERFRRGMRGKVKAGLSVASGYTPYGYRKVHTKKPFEIVPQEAEWVRWMYERRLEGWGYARLAKELGERNVPPPKRAARWLESSVKYILHNPYYAGIVLSSEWHHGAKTKRYYSHRPQRQTRSKGKHEPIIDVAMYEAAQRINRRRKRDAAVQREQNASEREGRYIFSGLVRCAFCGGTMCYSLVTTKQKLKSGQEKRYRYVILRCGEYQRSAGQVCQCNYHRGRKLHATIIDQIKGALADHEAAVHAHDLNEQQNRRQEKIDALRAELRDIERRLQVWYDALESGQFPLAEVAKRQRELSDRREDRQQELDDLLHDEARQQTSESIWRDFVGLKDSLDTLPPDKIRAVAINLIDSIILERGKPPRIIWAQE